METFNSVVKLSFLFLSSFTCCPSCEGTHHHLSIEVKKYPLIGSQTVINCSITSDVDIFAIKLVKDGIKIVRNDTRGKLYLGETLKGRGSVKGCVARRKANLSLTIDEVKIDDTGKYSCEANIHAARIKSQNAMLTTAVKPESVHITSEVKEETTLQLTCMGNIGNPSGNFSWHLCNETNCKPLTGNNIKLGDIEKVPGSCQYNGSSTLTFNHSKESSPFYIQCLVSYNNDGATYNVIALKRFDYSVTSVQEDQQNNGLICIGIAVAMLACFAIIIVVICLVKKKKIKGRSHLWLSVAVAGRCIVLCSIFCVHFIKWTVGLITMYLSLVIYIYSKLL